MRIRLRLNPPTEVAANVGATETSLPAKPTHTFDFPAALLVDRPQLLLERPGMIYFREIFWGRNRWKLALLCLLVYVHHFIDELMSAPINRLIEYSICKSFFDDQTISVRALEVECKVEQVQKRVLYIIGWLYSLDCLPGR
jgi:hypothetical protein